MLTLQWHIQKPAAPTPSNPLPAEIFGDNGELEIPLPAWESNGTQKTIASDTNLLPENIKDGVEIFGVEWTFDPAEDTFYTWQVNSWSLTPWQTLTPANWITVAISSINSFWWTWPYVYSIDSINTAVLDSFTLVWDWPTWTITASASATPWAYFAAVRISVFDSLGKISKYIWNVFIS